MAESPASMLSPDGRWRWDGARWQPVSTTTPRPPGSTAPTWVSRLGGRLLDFRVARAADWRVLAGVGIAAVAVDAALRAPRVGLAATLVAIAVCAWLVASRRVAHRQGVAVLAAAALLSVFLTLRDSPWLVTPDVVVVSGLVVLVCAMAPSDDLLDVTSPRAVAAWVRASLHVAPGPWFAAPPLARTVRRLVAVRGTHAWAAVRGVALALPVLALIGWLLAQADPVFASFFQVSFDAVSIATHVLFLAIGAWLAAGLARAASSEPMGQLPRLTWRLGTIEGLVVLAGLDLVFGAFTVAQVVAATGAGAATLRAYGLTYAEYAHSGFFQLLWVAAITLVVLLALRCFVVRSRAFVVLAEVAIALTLVIVFVAHQRLLLYVQAYDLSMLRLYSLVFASWIGVVFVALGLSLTRLGRARHWFPMALAVSGMIGLLALNVVNPEALLTRYNLAQGHQTRQLDAGYLASLSADAVPDLVAALPSLHPADAAAVRSSLCRPASQAAADPGWNGYNAAATAAADARRRACDRPFS